MAEGPDKDDRTEAPTPRRLDRAREEGQVAVSPELAALAVLGAGALVLALAAPGLSARLVGRLGLMLEQAHRLQPEAALRAALLLAATTAAPFVLAGALAAVAATLAQTGFLFHLKALAPDVARLSPARGLRRLFGVSGLVTTGKAVLKVAVVGFAAWSVLAGALPLLQQALGWDALLLSGGVARLVLELVLAMAAAQALLALGDVALTRIRHARSLRMSRQELRDETKEMDGDPQIKARLRNIRMQRARRRMLAAVPKATVVVTNPTHYAVALTYERDGAAAPRIVAKGVDEMAARIRAAAQLHGVPVVANPPLARALYPHPLDREIPAEFYQPVAEIIAYVWRLRGQVR